MRVLFLGLIGLDMEGWVLQYLLCFHKGINEIPIEYGNLPSRYQPGRLRMEGRNALRLRGKERLLYGVKRKGS